MVIEAIIGWFESVLTHAISLLPVLGHTLDQVPASSFALLKTIGILNGYIPIKTLGLASGVCLGIFLVMQVFVLLLGAYNQLSKSIP